MGGFCNSQNSSCCRSDPAPTKKRESIHFGAPKTRKFGFRVFKPRSLVFSFSPSLLPSPPCLPTVFDSLLGFLLFFFWGGVDVGSLSFPVASGHPHAFLSHPFNQMRRPSLFYLQTKRQKPGRKLDGSHVGFLAAFGKIKTIPGREIGSNVWLDLEHALSSVPKEWGPVDW